MTKQQGPGRPPTRKAYDNLNVRCSYEFKKLVKELARQKGLSQGALIELAVRRLT